LLPTTEARVMAGHAGQLVMVVSSNMTTEAQLRDAIATVDAVPVKLMVLNRATAGGHAEHGYGYSYSRRTDAPALRRDSEPAFSFNRSRADAEPDLRGADASAEQSAAESAAYGQSPSAARSGSILSRMFSRRGGSSASA